MIHKMRERTRRRREQEAAQDSSTATLEAVDEAAIDDLIRDIDDLAEDVETDSEESSGCAEQNLEAALKANWDEYQANARSYREFDRDRNKIYKQFGTTRRAHLEKLGCGCGCPAYI